MSKSQVKAWHVRLVMKQHRTRKALNWEGKPVNNTQAFMNNPDYNIFLMT